MQFGILGPLEVRTADGELVSVGGPRPRALLSLLLLDNGRIVSVERLISELYGEAPPAATANAIQALVSRLRRSLPAAPIEFTGGGYRLSIEPSAVDAYRFEQLLVDARSSSGTTEKAAKLRAALALWRGRALAELPPERPDAVRLEELRLAATEDLVDAAPTAVAVADLRRL